jgi:putative membrane protein
MLTRALAWTFAAVHVLGLALATFGILVAVPHPSVWASGTGSAAFFAYALTHTGAVSLVFAALAITFYGGYAIGWPRTLIFAAVSCIVSATAELTGTATGWPFGGYEYTGLLGAKLAGRVPFSVPLSWYFMGFAAYVLGCALVQKRARAPSPLAAIAVGAWLLTGWDLVLDPAMASPTLQYLRFWTWTEHGPYFGMPLRNLAGWYATGFAFIALARLLWRTDIAARRTPLALPYVIYAANIVWAMLLSLSAGLWPSALLAVVFTLLPATLALL